MKLTYKPLTKKTWNDFKKLFGERVACGGCWCMAWRLKPSQFAKQKGAGNKKAIHKLISKDRQIGIIGYLGKEPIGWCAFSSREEFIRLENSKVLSRVDNLPVWSITCFFILKEYRRHGFSTELLKCVIEFCTKINNKKRSEEDKIKILEGYPTVPYSRNIPAAFAWTGIPSSFEKAGFKEVVRRSKSRPIMRYCF